MKWIHLIFLFNLITNCNAQPTMLQEKEITLHIAGDKDNRSFDSPDQKDFHNFFIQVNYDSPILLKKTGKPFNGTIKILYPNGSTASIWKYKNGIKEGDQYIYFENGKIKNIWKISNGFKNGLSVIYFENGKIGFEETYKDNLLDSGRFAARKGRQSTGTRTQKKGA